MTTPHDAIVDRTLAAWNAADPAERRARVAAAWAEQGSSRGPPLAADGHPRDPRQTSVTGFVDA